MELIPIRIHINDLELRPLNYVTCHKEIKGSLIIEFISSGDVYSFIREGKIDGLSKAIAHQIISKNINLLDL